MISNKMSEFESLVVIDTADKESSSTQTFQEYKKVHEKQVMQALSTLTKKTEIEETSNALQTTLSEFHFNLYAKVKEFTSAFHDLKNAIQTHTRQKYMDFGSVLMARNESLVSEIESYNPFQECGGVMVEEDDCEPEWNQFIQSEFLPFEFGEMLMAVMVQVRNSGRNLLTFTNVSSQEWVPSSMSMDILKAGLKCCQEIKFLVQFCVKMSEKMYSNSSEESRMREMWRRRCLQSEKVKDMFKLWQKQIKMGETNLNLNSTVMEFLRDSDEGLVYEMVAGSKFRSIKGGKMSKLIEMMTSVLNQDSSLNACMIMSHHSYSTSIELFDNLIRRYSITPPFGLNQGNFDAFVTRKILPIRQHVCSLIQNWIELYYQEDYYSNPALMKKLRNFIEERLLVDNDKMAETFFTLLQEKSHISTQHDYKYKIVPAIDQEYLEIDPKQMAKQLTLIEHELFRKIKVYECSDQIWGDRRRKELSKIEGGKYDSSNVGMSTMIRHTNQLTMWIASRMLVSDTPKGRVTCIKYFTAVASMCRELGNYNAITAISAAFSVAPVGRLKATWALFEKSMPKVKDELTILSDLVSPKGQYVNYRKVLKDLKVPAIPFLGVYLTDMTFLELGNGDYLPESSFINVDKRRKVYQIILDIQKFQNTGYKFEDDDKIASMPHYWEMESVNENVMYDRSLEVEPREEDMEEE